MKTPRDYAKPDEADLYDRAAATRKDAMTTMRQLWHRWNTRMRRDKEK